jgi:uncharacterized membrane protein
MHPTGNPTYTLLTHLFACLPVGDVAHRVNLSSAVFGVLAVAVAYAVGLVLSRQVVAAAAGRWCSGYRWDTCGWSRAAARTSG